MTWLKVIQLLPELWKLAETILRSRDIQAEEKPMTVKEAKELVRKTDEAWKEKDSEKISAAFNTP